jgi:hypothetical protein
MKAFIELEAFAANVKLPDGIHFKEWDGQWCIVVPKFGNGGFYLNTHIIGLERNDGKLATFEFSSFINNERGLVMLPVSELAQAVDEAIAKLESA